MSSDVKQLEDHLPPDRVKAPLDRAGERGLRFGFLVAKIQAGLFFLIAIGFFSTLNASVNSLQRIAVYGFAVVCAYLMYLATAPLLGAMAAVGATMWVKWVFPESWLGEDRKSKE